MEDRLTITPEPKDSLQNGFYHIDRTRILDATTPEYRSFLKEAGYGDLDSCSRIGFAKGILKYDQAGKDAAARAGLSLTGNDGNYVVNINQPNARKLVKNLGCKVPTAGLMYRLFIPYIKELAQNGNAEAQATLNEMINTKTEWLEDLILDKTRLKIGTQERRLVLLDKNGGFDRQDINEFGYPTAVRESGEFYHWHARGNESAAIRYGLAVLGLSLGGDPSLVGGVLGVRCAKIF